MPDRNGQLSANEFLLLYFFCCMSGKGEQIYLMNFFLFECFPQQTKSRNVINIKKSIKMHQGYWRVVERTTFMEYVTNEVRGGAKGTLKSCVECPSCGTLFFLHENNFHNKRRYFILIHHTHIVYWLLAIGYKVGCPHLRAMNSSSFVCLYLSFRPLSSPPCV